MNTEPKSDEWGCMLSERGFTEEHYAAFHRLNMSALQHIIPELVCAYPEAGAMLKNRWLTAPQDIVARVAEEYAERTREQQSFRKDSEADLWLHELSCAVIAPLAAVPREHLPAAESFLFYLVSDEERLANITCRGDGCMWHDDLCRALFTVLIKNSEGRPDYLHSRSVELSSISDVFVSLDDMCRWLDFPVTEDLKAILREFVPSRRT